MYSFPFIYNLKTLSQPPEIRIGVGVGGGGGGLASILRSLILLLPSFGFLSFSPSILLTLPSIILVNTIKNNNLIIFNILMKYYYKLIYIY